MIKTPFSTYRLIATAVLLCLGTVCAWAYSFMERGIAYNASGNRAVVTSTSDITRNYYGLLSARIPAYVVHDGTSYQVTTINDRAFMGCPTLTSMTILPGVSRIGSQAFQGCSRLSSISIPQGIIEINDATFAGCSSLSHVQMASTITSIAADAFNGCASLGSVTLPLGLNLLGERAFKDCATLREVTLNSRVRVINKDTFAGCSSLEAVRIPDNVWSIEERAFGDCASLSTVRLGINVNTVSHRAFEGCHRFATIEVDASSPYFNTLNGMLTDVDRNKLLLCPPAYVQVDGHISLPTRLVSIGEYAFAQNSRLKSITFGSALAEVEQYAFAGCASIDTIAFPTATRYFGDRIFEGCSKLGMVRFGNSVVSFGSALFNGCDNMRILHIRERNPQLIDIAPDAFDYIKEQCTLYVPLGLRERYESMEAFQGFKAIVEEAVELKGDINGDDITNGADLTLLFGYLLDADNRGFDLQYFDVNEDGTINGTDVTELYNILLQ